MPHERFSNSLAQRTRMHDDREPENVGDRFERHWFQERVANDLAIHFRDDVAADAGKLGDLFLKGFERQFVRPRDEETGSFAGFLFCGDQNLGIIDICFTNLHAHGLPP